jgi:hypothetical protein
MGETGRKMAVADCRVLNILETTDNKEERGNSGTVTPFFFRVIGAFRSKRKIHYLFYISCVFVYIPNACAPAFKYYQAFAK